MALKIKCVSKKKNAKNETTVWGKNMLGFYTAVLTSDTADPTYFMYRISMYYIQFNFIHLFK